VSSVLERLRPAGERAIAVFGTPLSVFPSRVRQTVVIETTAAAILTAFNCTALPYTGLILRLRLHATADQLAVLAAANASVMLPSLLWARLVRNRPPLPVVVWFGVAYRGLFVLLVAVHSPWPFIAILAVSNALGAISGQAYSTFVQVAYPREFRGQALGVIRAAGALLAIGVFPLTGFLFARIGYPAMFAAAAVFGIAASLWQARLATLSLGRASLHEDPRPRPIHGAVRDDRRFARILAAAFLFGLGIWLMIPLAPLMQVDVLHASTLHLGIAAACASTCGLFAVGYWGRSVDRRSSVAVLRTVYMLGIVTPQLYLAGFALRTPWLVLGPSMVDSFVSSGLDIVANLAVIDVAGRQSGQYIGIYQTLAGVRGVIGPFLGAWLLHHLGIHSAFVAAAVVMMMGAALAGSATATEQTAGEFVAIRRGGRAPNYSRTARHKTAS
jgi:MFS family permease